MKISKAKTLLTALVKQGRNTLLLSRPGIGKSELVNQTAKSLEFDLITFYPVTSEPIDYKGFPFLEPGSPFAGFKIFGDLGKLITAQKPLICFFDELGQSLPAVQAAIAQLILSRQINGELISDKVVFIAATNDKNDKSNVSGMLQHLRDRFYAILKIDFCLDDFLAYGINNDFDSTVLGFCKFRPNYLQDYKPTTDLTPTISPRKIEYFSNVLKTGIYDVDLSSSMLGEPFAIEFDAFRKSMNRLPDLSSILDGSISKYDFSPDILFVVLIALSKKLDHINCQNVCNFVSRLDITFQSMFFAVAQQNKIDIISNNPFFANWLCANQANNEF